MAENVRPNRTFSLVNLLKPVDIFIDRQFHPFFEREPLTLVDVGASGGLIPGWNRAGRWLRVIAFEPDAREFGNLTGAQTTLSRPILADGFVRRRRAATRALYDPETRGIFDVHAEPPFPR